MSKAYSKRIVQVPFASFLNNLTLLLIALKLTEMIDWPWWQVVAPLGACVVMFAAVLAIVAVIEIADNL